jgi:hypothetical protein
MVPAPSALLALLALKLLDKERRGHIDDFNFDEVLGLFAGSNILPKKSFATDYSYRTTRGQQLGLLQAWVCGLAPLLFPEANTFSLDFHPLPYRGEPAGLECHYLPRRGVAGTSIQGYRTLFLRFMHPATRVPSPRSHTTAVYLDGDHLGGCRHTRRQFPSATLLGLRVALLRQVGADFLCQLLEVASRDRQAGQAHGEGSVREGVQAARSFAAERDCGHAHQDAGGAVGGKSPDGSRDSGQAVRFAAVGRLERAGGVFGDAGHKAVHSGGRAVARLRR